jgi:hypothetical protein
MGRGIADSSYEQAGFKPNNARNQRALYERMFWRVLTELAVNRFKWEGLPDTVDPRFLELCLFRQACVVFYEDSRYGYLALRGTGAGRWDMYDNPTAFQVTGNSFVNKVLKVDECVPIWANDLRAPDLDIVSLYARRLAELSQTIDILIKNMRVSRIVVTDENQKHSWSNIMRMVDQGIPVIYASQALEPSAVTVLDAGSDPQALSAAMIAFTRSWNDCLALLGINGANQDKKERLVADEVAANDDQVDSAKWVNLNARQYACDQINAKYNLNISVGYRSDIEAEEKAKEAQENGDVHDGSEGPAGNSGGNS